MNTNLEKREIYTPSSINMREGDGANMIDGVAIVVEKETVLYEGSDYREIEVIGRECLDENFIREQDITLNLLHDRDASIARTPSSLRVDVRENGLHFEADIPDCDLGKRAKALIENGTYTGCSFEFYPKDYAVSEREGADGKHEYVIRHSAFASIRALTIAMNPAYKQTEVGLRELCHIADEGDHDAEKAKREAEEAEAKAKAEAEERQKEMDIRDRKIAQIHRDIEETEY